jgi:beta-lysine 5,6-aminomutase beta subunit
MNIDYTNIKPYGDALNDGKMQLSFTLPVEANEKGKEAARRLLQKMGFDSVQVVHYNDIGEGFTMFIAYASATVSVNYEEIDVKVVDTPKMDMYEVDDYINQHIGRNLTVVGACIETDAHTVGIDAIMNMKGYHGDYGLERYKRFTAVNMGSQVTSEDLLAKAKELDADVILVSQVVTQNDLHIKNLTRLIEIAEAEGMRDKMLFICGGPRISHELALELGYDAGFGSHSVPSDVASYIALTLDKRLHQ